MSKLNIVVLANSVKHSEHCVAGKTLLTKKWIRLVSSNDGAELSKAQASCSNPHGVFVVKPLQKVELGVSHHAPLINQPENHVIDNTQWVQKYKIDDDQVSPLLDNPDDLWGEGDRVSYSSVECGNDSISQSLFLVKVENLKLYLNTYNKRRAAFSYNGVEYNLAVTDPRFDAITSQNIPIQNILCISLGEAYEGNCFKLVATIF